MKHYYRVEGDDRFGHFWSDLFETEEAAIAYAARARLSGATNVQVLVIGKGPGGWKTL